MDYYIYLKNTKEYIVETDDDLIWTRCGDINYAFNDVDYDSVNRIAQFICKDKHLSYKDVEIIGEEIVLHTTKFPVGNLKQLFYFKGMLSDTLDGLYELMEQYNFLYELDELTFSEIYYTIDSTQELLDWCEVEGYNINELEKDFRIKIWEE
jgi:hypothetical protein